MQTFGLAQPVIDVAYKLFYLLIILFIDIFIYF